MRDSGTLLLLGDSVRANHVTGVGGVGFALSLETGYSFPNPSVPSNGEVIEVPSVLDVQNGGRCGRHAEGNVGICLH